MQNYVVRCLPARTVLCFVQINAAIKNVSKSFYNVFSFSSITPVIQALFFALLMMRAFS